MEISLIIDGFLRSQIQYICMYVYMCAQCQFIYICVFIYTHTNMCLYIYTHINMCLYVQTSNHERK